MVPRSNCPLFTSPSVTSRGLTISLSKNYFTPIPTLTDQLARITIFKVTTDDPSVFDPHLFFSWGLCVGEIRFNEDFCHGNVIICDLGNCGLGHLLKTTPSLMKKAATVLEKVYTSSVKGMHFINSPPIVDRFLMLFKQVVSQKVQSRIFVHHDLESLYEQVPLRCLPRDYGGTQPSLAELSEKLRIKALDYEDNFQNLTQLRVDESVRPDKLVDDDIFGFHGNFKKLDVD